MLRVKHIDRLPTNFAEFVAEVAEGIAALYGENAGQHYRRTARASFQATIAHPDVYALAIHEGHEAAGLLVAVMREEIGQISFLHILRRYTDERGERLLVNAAVRDFRAGGIEGILAECVGFCPLRLNDTYRALGFEKVERLLMAAPLDPPGLAHGDAERSAPYGEEQWESVADTIVDAYRGHPGRRLHIEVRDRPHAMTFLKSVASGGYGRTRPGYGRAAWINGECAGVIVGCEIAPEVGFVLQVAVRPSHRNQGLGTALLHGLTDEFRHAGLTRVALGVTRANPASRLYARLGFEPLRPVNAYVWWRP